MGTTIGLSGAAEPVALQSDLEALAARVTKLESGTVTPPPPPPPPGLVPSPTNTFITAAAGAPIVDDVLNQWFLVAASTPGQTGLQIAAIAFGAKAPAVVDAPTQNVTQLGIQLVNGKRTVVQKNQAGDCYENPTLVLGAWNSFAGPVPPGTGSTPPPATGELTVANGQIMLNGAPFIQKGISVLDSTMASTPPSGIRSLFGPALNTIMLAIGADGNGYQTAQPNDAIVAYVKEANAAGFWVGLSDYVPGQPQARTGQDLTNSLAWYVALSQACAGLQIFWTTENEVQGQLDDNLTAIYEALRGAGDTNFILIEGGGTNQLQPGTVENMENVGWNVHIYPWEFTSQPQQQSAYDAAVQGIVSEWQGFAKSADGVMPVVNGECGNSTSGNGVPPDDPIINGNYATVQAALDVTGQTPGLAGTVFWIHDWHGGGGEADTLVISGALTQYGQQVVTGFAAD